MLCDVPIFTEEKLRLRAPVKHLAQGLSKQYAPSKGQKHIKEQGHLASRHSTKLPLRSPTHKSNTHFLESCFVHSPGTQHRLQPGSGRGLVCVRLCSACSFHCSGLESRIISVPPHTCPESVHILAPCASAAITQPATHSALGASEHPEERVCLSCSALGASATFWVVSLFF